VAVAAAIGPTGRRTRERGDVQPLDSRHNARVHWWICLSRAAGLPGSRSPEGDRQQALGFPRPARYAVTSGDRCRPRSSRSACLQRKINKRNGVDRLRVQLPGSGGRSRPRHSRPVHDIPNLWYHTDTAVPHPSRSTPRSRVVAPGVPARNSPARRTTSLAPGA
jgi:hypothetical protein